MFALYLNIPETEVGDTFIHCPCVHDPIIWTWAVPKDPLSEQLTNTMIPANDTLSVGLKDKTTVEQFFSTTHVCHTYEENKHNFTICENLRTNPLKSQTSVSQFCDICVRY